MLKTLSQLRPSHSLLHGECRTQPLYICSLCIRSLHICSVRLAFLPVLLLPVGSICSSMYQHRIKAAGWWYCPETLNILLRGTYDFLLFAPVYAAGCTTVLCAFPQLHLYKNQCFSILHNEVYFCTVASRRPPVALHAAQPLPCQKLQRSILTPVTRFTAVVCLTACTIFACTAFLRYIVRCAGLCGGGRHGTFACTRQHLFPNLF